MWFLLRGIAICTKTAGITLKILRVFVGFMENDDIY
jgi:hypothetical protein